MSPATRPACWPRRGLACEDGSTLVEMLDPADAQIPAGACAGRRECPQLPDQIEDVALTRALLRARVAALPE